ncbi:hypothetical protein C4J81_13595 [Deltaproteobacteria bacterium Smac51]|nr:hypothetical protein C4J81_13595 [Deltaproteobacteria bacterium Smac51]
MFPFYDVLNQQEIEAIHEASLKVLEETGVYLSHPKAQEVLSAMGATVSDDRARVFIPRALVDKMLATVPASFICGGREPEFDLEMKQGNTYMRQVGGPISLFDMRTSKTKNLTLEDNINSALLIDGLPNINVASCMTPQDIEPKTYDIAVVKALLENSRKHFWALTTHSSHLKYELEMAEVVAGGADNLKKRPPFSGIFCVIDPLRYPDDEVERLMLYGKYNIPVRVPITSLIGANSPYTLAGSLTQINAEFLSSVVITQAMCPGIGLWYYTLLQILDMRSGRSVANGPELMIAYAGAARMARHYNVPSTFSTGTLTDTQSHQALYHYGSLHTLAAMLGITEQGGAGSIQAATFYSHQALVLINESLAYTRKLMAGFEMTPETLATEDIKAMSASGEYISSKLTMKYLRKEKRFTPEIMDWRQLAMWEQDPSTIIDRAAARADQLIAKAKAENPPLPAEVTKELNRLMSAAEKEFV